MKTKRILHIVLLWLLGCRALTHAGETTDWLQGHGDIVVHRSNLEWRFGLRLDTALGRELSPDEVVIRLRDEARVAIPGLPAFSFLGRAGDPIWIAPQSQAVGVPYIGISSTATSMGTLLNDRFHLLLTALEGPGGVVLWTTGGTGVPTVHMDSRDGFSAADRVDLTAGGHRHMNWGFTAPGPYGVTLVASGELAGGERVTSDPAVFHFEVSAPGAIDRGELDLELTFVEGVFGFGLIDEASGVEHSPDDVELVVRGVAATPVPADPAFRFLGDPGAVVHVLPQSETDGLLFLGIAADEIASGLFQGESIGLRLVAVDGPGSVALYSTDGFGVPSVFWNSADGLTAADLLPVVVGSHAHHHWAFGAPGVYRLGVTAVGTLIAGDRAVESDVVTFVFRVQVPAVIELSASRIGDDRMRIGWNSEAGAIYRLRSRTSLSGGSWIDEGEPVLGDGRRVTRDVAITGELSKIFQVVELP